MTPTGTLRSLLERLEREGCRQEGVNGLMGPRGPAQVRTIVREADGVKRVAQIPNMNDNEPLYPATARSMLQQLGLKPDDYGFPLSDWD